MSWTLTVWISAGMVAIGLGALVFSSKRSLRPLACATACAGMALLFAALARDRGDAAGLLAAWLVLGVWSVFAIWSWHAGAAADDRRADSDQELKAP